MIRRQERVAPSQPLSLDLLNRVHGLTSKLEPLGELEMHSDLLKYCCALKNNPAAFARVWNERSRPKN